MLYLNKDVVLCCCFFRVAVLRSQRLLRFWSHFKEWPTWLPAHEASVFFYNSADFQVASQKAILPVATWSVCPSVCSSVTLLHSAKAVGRNELPFGRDTRVVRSNIVLDGGPGPPAGKGDLGGRNPQFAAMLPVAKFLWPLFSILHTPVYS